MIITWKGKLIQNLKLSVTMRSSWQRAVNLRRDDVGAKKRNVRGISMMYVD